MIKISRVSLNNKNHDLKRFENNDLDEILNYFPKLNLNKIIILLYVAFVCIHAMFYASLSFIISAIFKFTK